MYAIVVPNPNGKRRGYIRVYIIRSRRMENNIKFDVPEICAYGDYVKELRTVIQWTLF
jgi:hypothetical protein